MYNVTVWDNGRCVYHEVLTLNDEEIFDLRNALRDQWPAGVIEFERVTY